VPIVLVVATIVWFAAAMSVWVNRQALNTDNWTETSSKLLAHQKIDNALGAYLVNQLFTSVDVPAAIRQQLPSQLQALAGPVAGGLREVAGRAAPELLASPQVQTAWRTANRTAHKQLLRVINGGGSAVSTKSGDVTLDLHPLVTQLAANLGLASEVAAVRSKLKGSAGQQARGVAQQKLGLALPSSSGKLVIMRSNQLKTAQDVSDAIRHLALVLPIVGVALFALAVWLARGWRRRVVRTTGWCFVAVGVLLLLIRRIAGNQIVNSLVNVDSNKPAVHEAWSIATSLLYSIAVALIVYGLLIAFSAWLAGPTRSATFVRKALAPTLRDRPAVVYGAVGGVLLLVVAWGPTPAFRQLAWVVLIAALLALGVTVLRQQTAVEFAGVHQGDAMRELREKWSASRARRAAPASAVAAPAPGGDAGRVAELERLATLHDRGALTDEEYALEKTHLLNVS
jgi:hypothetical protein